MTSDPNSTFVFTQLPGSEERVVAGRYEAGPEGIGSFVYAKSYLARDDAWALDPRNLPLSDRQFRTTLNGGMFGALRDAAPDAWGRMVMTRQGRAATELGFLLGTSDTRVGSLSFGPTPEVPALDLSSALRISSIAPTIEAAARLQDEMAGEDVPPIDPQLLDPASSLGGARPKATCIDDDGQLWVAKFPSREDPWENAVVEGGLLRLARECGIRTPDTRLIRVEGKRVLLVRRFDFRPGPLRRAVLSAHSVLAIDSGVTPLDRSRWSYNDFAHVLRAESEAPQKDAHELFRRVTFNALTTNEDDHPRNHALLRSQGGWRLSPAYDLTPARTLSVETRKHAMSIGRRPDEDPRLMRRVNLVSAAADFLLEESDADAIIDEIRDTVTRRWREVMAEVGASDATLRRVEHAFPEAYPGFEYPASGA